MGGSAHEHKTETKTATKVKAETRVDLVRGGWPRLTNPVGGSEG